MCLCGFHHEMIIGLGSTVFSSTDLIDYNVNGFVRVLTVSPAIVTH